MNIQKSFLISFIFFFSRKSKEPFCHDLIHVCPMVQWGGVDAEQMNASGLGSERFTGGAAQATDHSLQMIRTDRRGTRT